MKIFITGALGMVGRALTTQAAKKGHSILGYSRQDLDIANHNAVNQTIERDRPDAIINCAAWNDVDGCERDPKRAQEMLALGPEYLAEAAKNINANLITISTDYVFDGAKENHFYTQQDRPNPQSVYARAKLEGEHRAQSAWARTSIVRTGWIFGNGGKNFLACVLGQAREKKTIKAISDVYGTPTYAVDLANRLIELAERDLRGIYHVVNSGEGASFESFTRKLLEKANLTDVPVETVRMDDLKRLAIRPRNSRMKCLRSDAAGLKPLPLWESALEDWVRS